MKKIILILLLLASQAYAVDVTIVQGPETIFDGTDINPESVTTTRIDAETGVFNNLTAGDKKTVIRGTSPYIKTTDFSIDLFEVQDGQSFIRDTGGGILRFNPNLPVQEIAAANGDLLIRVDTANHQLILRGPRFLIGDDFIRAEGRAAHLAGIYNHMVLEPSYEGLGSSGYNTLFINQTTVSIGTGAKYLILAKDNNITKFAFDSDGSLQTHGGVKSAFRILSSTSETIVTADHTIYCLPNDNGVTLNFPPVDGELAQHILVKHIDVGSTNKCYVDGDGSEQVEGFDVYSLLDTYKECARFSSADTKWWKTGDCP